MSCQFILQRGKNKGKLCSLKGKMTLNSKFYCTRHYKIQEKQNVLHENTAMKKEDFNCNGKHSTLPLGNFIVIREIGKGAFGKVVLIQDKNTNKYYAMKITSNNVKKEADLLFYEYTLLSQHFTGTDNFPRLLPKVAKSYKRTQKETYLILEYFEETLQQRVLHSNLSEEQIKSYGIQMLNIIQYIHSKNYLYIDIKPENFMFKTKEDENIKIIDFGLCQKYVDYRDNHIVSKQLSNPIGTDFYASIRMMGCIQPGRIDDIECIGYLLLYLHRGELPWSNAIYSKEIMKMKQDDTTFSSTPTYIQEFILSSQEHNFDVKPDYDYFKNLLIN